MTAPLQHHRAALGDVDLHYVTAGGGGVTAFSLAAHHPDAVATLTVVDVTVPGAGGTDIAQGGGSDGSKTADALTAVEHAIGHTLLSA